MEKAMTTKITWFGHNTWLIESGGHKILIDPFLDDNPAAPVKAKDIEANFILVSHGHFDHIADAAQIAKRCQAKVLANYEVATWLESKQQAKDTVGMNHGGGVKLPFGHVKFVQAVHSSQMPDGSYGGNPGGWVLTLGSAGASPSQASGWGGASPSQASGSAGASPSQGKKIYFACDTALFSDMQLVSRGGLDLAVLPIGDLYTMGVDDSIEATRLLQPKHVAPCHYNTWPPIEQDADDWAKRIESETKARPIVLKPGESFDV
jgi:L-ascorbate metabolism protein UlaG (beta-lactamase superfamily)